jgi:hypothetical protein
MTSRKPTAAFWITVALVAVLVGYPLSFGPACWVTSRTNSGAGLVPKIYRPITWAMSTDETALGNLIDWYAEIGAPDDWSWSRKTNVDDTSDGGIVMHDMGWVWEWFPP